MATSLIDSLRGKLIVSCQAYPGEPMRDPRTMSQVAQSASIGGAAAVRVQGVEDIRATAACVDVPVIGLWKDGSGEVFITPTLEHALAVARVGADIVALDGTRRTRPDGLTLKQTIEELRQQTGALIMADCGSLADGLAAREAGADIVGTTLSGYTGERPKTSGPDLDLLSEMADSLDIPLVAEGRVRTPAHVKEAFEKGAFAVCVGSAITHPISITRRFIASGCLSQWPARERRRCG